MTRLSNRTTRRNMLKGLGGPLASLTVWTSPVVQALRLPAHAQTSPPLSAVCTRDDIPGTWTLNILGIAASTTQIVFHADGSADHAFINAWDYVNGELQMSQGTTWLMKGTFSDCDQLSGTYFNIIVIPPLGNVVIREGDWTASRSI